jgi:hypothetical protein
MFQHVIYENISQLIHQAPQTISDSLFFILRDIQHGSTQVAHPAIFSKHIELRKPLSPLISSYYLNPRVQILAIFTKTKSRRKKHNSLRTPDFYIADASFTYWTQWMDLIKPLYCFLLARNAIAIIVMAHHLSIKHIFSPYPSEKPPLESLLLAKMQDKAVPDHLSQSFKSPHLAPPDPYLPQRSILIKPHQLLPPILHILPSLHPHVKDRTISTRTDNFTMNTSLTTLTLRPQSRKPHF